MFLTKIPSKFFFFSNENVLITRYLYCSNIFAVNQTSNVFQFFFCVSISFIFNLKASVFAAALHLFRTYLQRNSNTFQDSFSDFYGTWVVSFLDVSMKQFFLDRYISFDFVFPLLSWSSKLCLSPCCQNREKCESFFLAIIFGVWNDLDFLVKISLFS